MLKGGGGLTPKQLSWLRATCLIRVPTIVTMLRISIYCKCIHLVDIIIIKL